ncbi:unnamed protein product [Calypogeia fissa]
MGASFGYQVDCETSRDLKHLRIEIVPSRSEQTFVTLVPPSLRNSGLIVDSASLTNASDMEMDHSCLGRQLAEVEVIRAMYPGEGEFCTTEAEAAAIEILSSIGDHGSTPIHEFLSISFTLHLLTTQVGGRHASVGFHFPRKYPQSEALKVTLKDCGGNISKSQHEMLSLGAQSAADQMVGEEAVFQVLQRVQELAVEIGHHSAPAPAPTLEALSMEPMECKNPHPNSCASSIQRKLIWFHHIKSAQKRKDILDWGSELKLGGFCKPGFPGILVFEGEADDVSEYVKRIQRLRWQALQIRGEEEEEVVEEDLMGTQTSVDSIRRFPVGITELPESGMSELAAKCREVQLEDLFLTALKISR